VPARAVLFALARRLPGELPHRRAGIGSGGLPARRRTGPPPRWNLKELHAALDARRRERGLTWVQLAGVLRCTPSQLTGLRTARFATGMTIAMRSVQWLERPAADFIYAARW
jgi:hypothetical protein